MPGFFSHHLAVPRRKRGPPTLGSERRELASSNTTRDTAIKYSRTRHVQPCSCYFRRSRSRDFLLGPLRQSLHLKPLVRSLATEKVSRERGGRSAACYVLHLSPQRLSAQHLLQPHWPLPHGKTNCVFCDPSSTHEGVEIGSQSWSG
jgi:hypothetical protein